MRFIICIVVLILSAFAQAQTIDNVSGDSATVSLQGAETLQVGDKVSFIDAALNVTGQGEVTYVSDSGRTANVKILSGHGKTGMSLEKTKAPSPPKTAQNSEESENVRHENARIVGSLDAEDRRILRVGEISPTAYIVGGIVGTYPIGLGLGHAIQGRYFADKGWMFTVGELGSLALVSAGANDCVDAIGTSRTNCNSSAILWGVIGFTAFRLWEIYDVWVTPALINRRYRELKTEMKPMAEFTPLIAPTQDGFLAGMQVRF